jgi:hypothetical protein
MNLSAIPGYQNLTFLPLLGSPPRGQGSKVEGASRLRNHGMRRPSQIGGGVKLLSLPGVSNSHRVSELGRGRTVTNRVRTPQNVKGLYARAVPQPQAAH